MNGMNAVNAIIHSYSINRVTMAIISKKYNLPAFCMCLYILDFDAHFVAIRSVITFPYNFANMCHI